SAVARIVGKALGAVVIGDHAVLLLEDRPLRLKHGVIHQQAVGEDNGFCSAAGLFVKEVYAVDQDCWHIFKIWSGARIAIVTNNS
ncbi:MAG: hypothetical protein ACXVJ1_16725, partial [Candidatus Angelobacter sp.]